MEGSRKEGSVGMRASWLGVIVKGSKAGLREEEKVAMKKELNQAICQKNEGEVVFVQNVLRYGGPLFATR